MVNTGDLPFQEGELLDQRTFHTLYEDTPEDFRAELVGGAVYFIPPGTVSQGRCRADLLYWIGMYHTATPGTEALGAVTVILGDHSEPQPAACLLLLPSHGGQAFENASGYLQGSPELVIEVWSGRETYSFDDKRGDYEQAEVREYLAVLLPEKRVSWLSLRDRRYEPLSVDDGIIRSRVFPGLWLNVAAMVDADGDQLQDGLNRGLKSPEHTAFAARLGSTR